MIPAIMESNRRDKQQNPYKNNKHFLRPKLHVYLFFRKNVMKKKTNWHQIKRKLNQMTCF